MQVFVNGKSIHLPAGMTVRHALIRSGLLHEAEEAKKVYDEWGNEVGLDGALSDGIRLQVK